MGKQTASNVEGVMEHIVRVVHLVNAEYCLQAILVENYVVGDERKPLYELFHLCPNTGEGRCVVGIFFAKAIGLRTPIGIEVWLWLDERVKRVCYLPIAHDNNTYGTD